MIKNQTPLVSVGLPVYNESAHIRRALESWLAQDYADFELIVADNASTDGTLEICREYAARDSRIRLIENAINIGASRNHKLVFEISRGDYFTWGGGHDRVAPGFLQQTLDLMQKNPEVVLCTVRSEFRDENDVCWRTNLGGLDLRGMPPVERFAGMLHHLTSGGTANLFYGLYRRDILAQVLEFQKSIGSDIIMLVQLAILAPIVQLDDILYYRFVPRRQRGSGEQRIARHVAMLFGEGSLDPSARLPQLGYLFGFLQMIENLPHCAIEKQAMMQTVMEEARRIQVSLWKEFENFIESDEREMASLASNPVLRQYRALKIVEGLNRAALFGLTSAKSKRLRRVCQNYLHVGSGTIARPKPSWIVNVLEKIAVCRSKLRNMFRSGWRGSDDNIK